MIKKFKTCILFLFLGTVIYAHPWEPDHHVIIDTDGGIDDMRAITLFLASPDIRVMGIIASPGVLSSENCYIKVKSLLNSLYHEGIPVATNSENGIQGKNCEGAINLVLGDQENMSLEKAFNESQLVEEILKHEHDKITFISLGSLNTFNKVFPLFQKYDKLKEVLWCNSNTEKFMGFNYLLDTISAKHVFSLNTELKIISPAHYEYTDQLINEIKSIHNSYSEIFLKTLDNEEMFTSVHKYKNKIFDEFTSLYLQFSGSFEYHQWGKTQRYFFTDTMETENYIIRILKRETENFNQVFFQFPYDSVYYQEDVRKIIYPALHHYGKEEWRASVLANEMHNHLGVYNVIGVKMGIRAREYYNAGMDEFRIVSYTGKNPPFSCMNDGLQVSTGATVGHGLITVSEDSVKLPMAEFHYLNKVIQIRLKDEIFQKIRKEIKDYEYFHGLNSDIYWELVRKAALSYWKNFDRHEIFEIKEIKQK